MLFNSPIFLFGFVPIVFAVYILLGWARLYSAALTWLILASLVFYGWTDPGRLLPLILCSIAFNLGVGSLLRPGGKRWLWIGVIGNLLLLGWFKYAGFFDDTLRGIGLKIPPVDIALPIGISFFTFTQIAFLVDLYRRKAENTGLLHYGLFVTFFPHLVAGPILHHADIIPQFRQPETYRLDPDRFLLGLNWFIAGLFKKSVLADGIAPYANAVFAATDHGTHLAGTEAWLGALSYSLQLYFDFSGYSDMAIGLALMFGITFPLNFFSPYKATSLIEFWRRWNMTLSAFLRDYLYIPLGGNRRGRLRRHLNLFVTMLLGGLWHGAAWTFVAWGALHGLGLIVNHLWRSVTHGFRLPATLGQGITLLFVVFAWVPFRASSGIDAARMWREMICFTGGENNLSTTGWIWVLVLAGIALFVPNTAEIFDRGERVGLLRWRPNFASALLFGAGLGWAVEHSFTYPTSFLYFRF